MNSPELKDGVEQGVQTPEVPVENVFIGHGSHELSTAPFTSPHAFEPSTGLPLKTSCWPAEQDVVQELYTLSEPEVHAADTNFPVAKPSAEQLLQMPKVSGEKVPPAHVEHPLSTAPFTSPHPFIAVTELPLNTSPCPIAHVVVQAE